VVQRRQDSLPLPRELWQASARPLEVSPSRDACHVHRFPDQWRRGRGERSSWGCRDIYIYTLGIEKGKNVFVRRSTGFQDLRPSARDEFELGCFHRLGSSLETDFSHGMVEGREQADGR